MISRACSTQAADFYPRPPRGGRPDDAPPPRRAGSFLSTPSARRATIPGRFRSRRIQISIHALREEGDRDVRGVADLQQISIHALREEGDRSRKCSRKPASRFLSTPSARRATASTAVCASTEEFLSTPSARRATRAAALLAPSRSNFYPRPPRGGRQQKQRQKLYFQTNYTTFCTNLEEP